jgi:hypothetical protein
MAGRPTTLTQEKFDQLCTVHREGRDFRNVTAIRCDVHPRLLTRWLKRGAANEEDGLYTELFMAFGRIEGAHRAEYNAELVNTTVHYEKYDAETRTRTVTKRDTRGLQFFMGKRYEQFADREGRTRDDECDMSELLEQMQAQQLTGPSARHIIAQFVAMMPAELGEPFQAWAAKALPQGQQE